MGSLLCGQDCQTSLSLLLRDDESTTPPPVTIATIWYPVYNIISITTTTIETTLTNSVSTTASIMTSAALSTSSFVLQPSISTAASDLTRIASPTARATSVGVGANSNGSSSQPIVAGVVVGSIAGASFIIAIIALFVHRCLLRRRWQREAKEKAAAKEYLIETSYRPSDVFDPTLPIYRNNSDYDMEARPGAHQPLEPQTSGHKRAMPFSPDDVVSPISSHEMNLQSQFDGYTYDFMASNRAGRSSDDSMTFDFGAPFAPFAAGPTLPPKSPLRAERDRERRQLHASQLSQFSQFELDISHGLSVSNASISELSDDSGIGLPNPQLGSQPISQQGSKPNPQTRLSQFVEASTPAQQTSIAIPSITLHPTTDQAQTPTPLPDRSSSNASQTSRIQIPHPILGHELPLVVSTRNWRNRTDAPSGRSSLDLSATVEPLRVGGGRRSSGVPVVRKPLPGQGRCLTYKPPQRAGDS